VAKKQFCKPTADYTTTSPQRKIKKEKFLARERQAKYGDRMA
jgi:hypothetical protein